MPTTLAPGVFHFRVIRDIGFGGLGRVDEIEVLESACEYQPGQRLARKRLNDQWKDQPTARARFEREIEAVRTLDPPMPRPTLGTWRGPGCGSSSPWGIRPGNRSRSTPRRLSDRRSTQTGQHRRSAADLQIVVSGGG